MRNIKKIIFFLVLTFAIGWIAFVLNELAQKKNTSDFLCYFDKQDSLVLAIHHKKEFDWESIGFNVLGKNKDLYYEITRNLDDNYSVFISKERPILVVEITQKWTKSSVKFLLKKGGRNFDMTGLNSFAYGQYIGNYSGTQLLLYPKDFVLEKSSNSPFKVDKKASYSIAKFTNEKLLIQDIYLKDVCKVVYETQLMGSGRAALANDRAIFSENLPANFDSYVFHEKNYLKEVDNVFAKSYFFNLIESGIVELIIDGQKVLVFDYLAGNSPIQNLNNLLKKEEENSSSSFFKGVTVKSGEEEINLSGFFISEANGFAYLSSSETAIDNVLTEIEMNHTLSSDSKRFNSLNNFLPIQTSERVINETTQESISRIGNKSIKTSVYLLNNQSTINENDTKDYFTMNPGIRITHYCSLAGRGNAIVFGENKTVYGYKNGTKIWSKIANTNLLSAPLVLDFSQNERESIALRFPEHIEVIDQMGRITQRIVGKFNLDPVRFLVNNKLQLLCPALKKLSAFNEQGKVTCSLNFTEDIQAISVYYEGKKPIASILTAANVQQIDLSNNRIISKTKLPENISNRKLVESGALIFTENQLYMLLDSKGIKTKLNIDQTWTLASHFTNQNIPHLLFTNLNQCLLMKNNSAIQWKKTWPIRGLSTVTVEKINNAVLFTVYDNLENNLYLYGVNGIALDQVNRPANATGHTTAFGKNGQSITTLLGNVLIQYTKY
jgi:hypothetical protein